MFTFLTFFNGNQQPLSGTDRDTLELFQKQLKLSQEVLRNATYKAGYGNITGFELSYLDNINGKNVSEWPLHHFDENHPWVEQEEFSILPDVVSNQVKTFWANEPVGKTIKDNIEKAETKTDSYIDKAYLLNVSGKAQGEFEIGQEKVQAVNLSLPEYIWKYYLSYTQERYDEEKERYENDPENNNPPQEPYLGGDPKVGNITQHKGRVSLNINAHDYNFRDQSLSRSELSAENAIDNAVIVNLQVSVKDYEEIENHNFMARGVYFQDTGSLISATRSAKFLGHHGLSQLTFNEERFNTSKTLMGQFFNSTNLENDINMDDMNNYVRDSLYQCEFVTYFQFEKTDYTVAELRFIDEELKNPKGRPLPKSLPELVVKDYLIYSPDCGLVLRKKPDAGFSGLKREIFTMQLKRVFIGLLVLVFVQLMALLRQMKVARTPGQLSVISSTTLFLIGLQDSMVTLLIIFESTLLQELYLLLACISVVATVMCLVFEVKFLVSVVGIQVNERGTTWWEILRGGSNGGGERAVIEPAVADAPILPTTNAPAVTPAPTNVPVPFEEASFSYNITGVGFITTILLTFLVLKAMEWRITYRRVFEYVILLALNSYWIPQFLRNTLKNRRTSFSWEFIFVTSSVRVVPVMYLSLVKSNPLKHHFDPLLVIVVINWLLLQMFLLYLQNTLGPRFWLNDLWLPKAYDYQNILVLGDLENGGFSSDIIASVKPELEHDGIIDATTTCSICMADILIPILAGPNTNEARKKVNNKEYMITPCHHIFHAECLQSWMKYKLQCPVCRESLPPI